MSFSIFFARFTNNNNQRTCDRILLPSTLPALPFDRRKRGCRCFPVALTMNARQKRAKEAQHHISNVVVTDRHSHLRERDPKKGNEHKKKTLAQWKKGRFCCGVWASRKVKSEFRVLGSFLGHLFEGFWRISGSNQIFGWDKFHAYC